MRRAFVVAMIVALLLATIGGGAMAITLEGAATPGQNPDFMPAIGARYKSWANTGSRELYVGFHDLGVGANRSEQDATWKTGRCQFTAFGYEIWNNEGDGLYSSVARPDEYYQEVWRYNIAENMIAKTGMSLDQLNTVQIFLKAGHASTSATFYNVRIEQDETDIYLGTFEVGPSAMSGYWTFTTDAIDFSEEWEITGDLHMNGTFSGGDEWSRLEILVGYVEPEEDAVSLLNVTVVKGDGGSVSGIPVTIGGDAAATLTTNASGKVSLAGLGAGTYTVNASEEGYTSDGPKTVTLPYDDSEGSATITLTAVPPVSPAGPGAIEGKAKDETTAASLPGVLVRLLDSTDTMVGMTMTNPAGEFAFDSLAPGSYTVRGSLGGYGTDTEVAVVVNDATTEVELQLAAVIVVPPTPPATDPIVTPPDLPKTGATLTGLAILSGLTLAAGCVAKRKGF